MPPAPKRTTAGRPVGGRAGRTSAARWTRRNRGASRRRRATASASTGPAGWNGRPREADLPCQPARQNGKRRSASEDCVMTRRTSTYNREVSPPRAADLRGLASLSTHPRNPSRVPSPWPAATGMDGKCVRGLGSMSADNCCPLSAVGAKLSSGRSGRAYKPSQLVSRR
jgi:hypothetical protein